MPNLNTTIHVDMLHNGRHKRSLLGKLKWVIDIVTHRGQESNLPSSSLLVRFQKARRVLFDDSQIYGLEWGDPELDPVLKYTRDHFLLPYVQPDSVVVEIGPGGGRWTRYLITAARVYGVDYYQELLDELQANIKNTRLVPIKNNGTDFPNIENESVDFLFSFGTFVHLDTDLIDQYLINMRRILKPQANVVIQYSDSTKQASRDNPGFSDNDPDRMRKLLSKHRYTILEEDTSSFHHSSVVRFMVG